MWPISSVRLEQHVAIPERAASAPGLKQVLHHHADFAFDTTDGLLQHPREQRIRRVDAYGVLQSAVVVEH
jgi:hypothetical protein